MKAISTFSNVVKAVFIREIVLKSENNKYAYLNIFFEPLLPILFFAFLHASLPSTFFSKEEYIVFLFSGFLIFNTFKNIALKGYDAIDSNSGLFIYKQVKPIDTLFSRFLTEFFIFLISFSLFLLLGYSFDLKIIPDDIFSLLFGYFLLLSFSFSLTLFFTSFTMKFKFVKKIVNVIFMPLLFISAIFYTIKTIPYEWQWILELNPIALIMEIIHHAWFNKLAIVEIDYLYLSFWILFPAFIGLFRFVFVKLR